MKITIENHDGRLRLRWLYQAKRYTMGCGVDDDSSGRAFAKRKASQIELDVLSGNFDSSLLKYKPRLLGKCATEVNAPELFERFSQHKLKNQEVSPRSIETRYKPLLGYLQRSLNIPADQVTEARAKNFKALLLEKITPQTAKERLWLLQSCWDWA
jgi:integrase